MTKILLFSSVLLVAAMAQAAPTKTKYNPFTGRLDYITNIASTSAGELIDVSTTGVSNGQCLVWNSSTQQFEPGSCGSGGGGGGSGYAVEPATVTFKLNKGFIASTGTITNLSPGVLHLQSGTSNFATGLVSLSTETTGNYVGNVNTNASLTGGTAGSSGASLTLGIDCSSGTCLGNSIDLGTAEATGTLAAARFPALTGNVTTSAGSLATTIVAVPSTVLVSSFPASGVTAGTYGSATQVSSVTVNAQGTITGATNVTISLTNSNLQSGTYSNVTVPAANVAAGSLGGSVIASSVAVNAVQDASIVGVSASKLSGTVAIANGGTNGASFTTNKNVYYNGSGIVTDANMTVNTSSDTETGATGFGVTYGINVGSMTGAGLSLCGDSTHALSWNSSTNQFGCQSVTGSGGGGGGVSGSTGSITMTLDSSSIVGSTRCTTVPYSCTISSWSVVSDSGTFTMHVASATFANYPTVTTMSGSTPPSLTLQYRNSGTNSGWTTTVLNQSDVVCSVLDTLSGFSWANIVLWVIKS